jgi:hypothetical protein
MLWSCPYESPQRVRHGGGLHLGSEAAHAVLALRALQAPQSLRRPTTASPCKKSEKLWQIVLTYLNYIIN